MLKIVKELEKYSENFEILQNRFASKIVVAGSPSSRTVVDYSDFANSTLDGGFVDISVKPQDLTPLFGRVVLLLNRSKKMFNPAVITKRIEALQITRMDVPFDPSTGLTSGILFGLGLKNETADRSFGSHGYGDLESGHLTPAILGVADEDTKSSIIFGGDRGSHAVLDDPEGGAPEKMIRSGLLGDIKLDTRIIPSYSDNPIPIYWHKSLESNQGLQIAEYPGSIKLMLGSATLALGDEAVDRVGELVTHASKGAF